MIYIHNQEIRLWELIKWSQKRKCLDLLSNSLNTLFKEMYRDQFGEFVCGYWGLEGKETYIQLNLPLGSTALYRHLIITDSLLCPQGKKALTLSLNKIQPA